MFVSYKDQLVHIIRSSDWDYLLDCFYQVIPFGTGGRRGEVGIGPKRINKWTIQSSAQGHSQYLVNHYGEEAKKIGVVLTFGVREFFTNKHFNDNLENPVKNLTGKDLAYAAAEVYTANKIKVLIFDSPRTTPELSFTIRFTKAVAGDMFDASHNPPEHNGKKVYDEFGGQLIPPEDENLVTEVTQNVKEIKTISIDEAKNESLFILLGEKEDNAYFSEINNLSLSKSRSAILVYTPLHGVGSTSCFKLLEIAGFNITSDPKTSNQSGKFENVTFNIPNPEVRESFDTTLKFAMETNADLILNSDPDADRIGVMVKHKNKWVYLNGNEIGSILTRYSIEKWKEQGKKGGIVVKTTVTTNLATEICKANNIELIGDLPVGFKYIGEEMNKIEKEGRIDEFIFGLEESHGYIAGNYLRDKDAAIGALWLAELASELKDNNQTLVDYLDDTYSKYGYFKNYLTEIRLPGAEGMSQIRSIQDTLRSQKLTSLGKYAVNNVEDFWDRLPFLSETDKITKDVLIFHFEPFQNYTSIKITLRPSGTEPKAKMYFEIGSKPVNLFELPQIKEQTDVLLKDFEKLFMLHCFKVLGVDFPERGFLLFWQLPLKDKLHYFEIEGEIKSLLSEKDIEIKKEKLNKILEFLGNDPIEKVDKAFTAKYNTGIREYLSI
ncbi:MAG: phospho-sugar mutase [Candidatus Woesebacteria bacterium]|nr:phospho-sugar mutase [Candidatus Woesebacteria bacterium]